MNQTDGPEIERALREEREVHKLALRATWDAAVKVVSGVDLGDVLQLEAVQKLNETVAKRINQAVAGAYAAAAKLCDKHADEEEARGPTHPALVSDVDEYSRWMRTYIFQFRAMAKAILALTPADARQAQAADSEAFRAQYGKPSPCGVIGHLLIDYDAHFQGGPYCRLCRARECEKELDAALKAQTQTLLIHDFLLLLGYTPRQDELVGQATVRAAIASAEARARLEEAKWWYDRDARISYCRSSLHVPSGCERCMRIAELEAAARTPDSTKEQG